jgi:CheY-like chemotaxis protein
MAAKVMLVEDDTNLSDIYKARLEAEGFTIITAADGEAALALAVKEHPDLIISDVMMPKISGFDMLDILRSTDGIKVTKVIMMTALGQAEDKARAEKLGADRYLVKSQVTLEDVVRAVHEVLGDAPAAEPESVNDTGDKAEGPSQVPTAETASQPKPVAAGDTKPLTTGQTPAANGPTVTKVPVVTPPDDLASAPTDDATTTPPEPAVPVNGAVAQPLASDASTVIQPTSNVPSDDSGQAEATDEITGGEKLIAALGSDAASDNKSAALSRMKDFVSNEEADATKPADAPAAKAGESSPDDDPPTSEGGTKVIQPLPEDQTPKPQFNLEQALAKEAAQEKSEPPASGPLDNSHQAGSVIKPAGSEPGQADPDQVAL